MTSEEFPRLLGIFLDQQISSVAQLEILLLLRSRLEQTWTAAAVDEELRITPAMAREQLVLLAGAGLITADAGAAEAAYRYQPGTPEIQQRIDELADCYAARRVAVITRIYSKPLKSVRTFAEAFRLRKEK
ncbi:hypothetical protein [Planctomicrobium piriforme]|uniref:Transcriptional regulator n=1 Tax=Planctomicrobium piriforme TaxID=1576369 RepID=A0A1I3RX51_9PLAN|nr:hypothetical protein [Planctomicrobium piriforme]SFJ51153.1 hypothetical protein SAMN05421753_12237 [Planctomicrobium piriforme]